MRKWMRERVKRRKPKAEEQSKTEEALQPLQPAYFDAQQTAPETTAAEVQPEAGNSAQEDTAPAVDEGPEGEEQAEAGQEPRAVAEGTAATGPVRRRRRRGRGGRGRSTQARVAAAAPVQPAEAAAEAVPARASIPAEAPRASKGAVVLAVGLPGSGKSSWFKRHKISPLSSDLLRALLFDDPTEQRFQDLVFSNLRSMLKARLIARRPLNYVDATNLSPHERHTWIKMARDYGYEVNAVYFDVPVEVCMERNRRRERNVPEDVMRRLASKLRPPTFEEGFTKITVVRVKKKEDGTADTVEDATA
jgi:predicted kinase